MNRFLTAAFCLAACGLAAAQETEKYDKDGLSFEIPKGENNKLITENFNWAKDWEGTLAEFWIGEDIGGRLVCYESTMTAKQYVEWRSKDWLTRFKGSWENQNKGDEKRAELECAVKTEEQTYRYVHVAYATGKKVYDLMMWAKNETFSTFLSVVRGIVKTVKYSASGSSGDSGTGNTGGAKAVKVAKHLWKEWGKGTLVSYKMVNEFSGQKMEMTMTMELVDKDDSSYTIKTVMEMPGGVKNETTQKYEVDPKAGEGGSGTGTGEKPKMEKGKETIKVPAGEFDCEWVQTESSGTVTKAWNSDKVPGGLVKSHTKMAAGTTVMELVKLEKK
ncbi:MAG: hypothetical protein HYY17_10460 [Planctomycetes bacterium]|nr:hypothetical protein [Planctomycetota bacterium]